MNRDIRKAAAFLFVFLLATDGLFAQGASGSITGTLKGPDALRNGNLPRGERGPDNWFDTAAYARQAANTFGNAGVGTIWNPGIANVDFALQKRFSVTESKYFEFRAEAFNIFNTPLFTGVGRVLGNSTFGKITAAQAERELQMGLKFYF
jgi:hypothetical protein